MDLSMRRCGSDATEENMLYAESIASTQDAADIVHGAHIVEHHNKR
jgi:hypothetical protein